MNKIIQLAVLIIMSITTAELHATLTVTGTVCEYLENPVGIDIEKPRLSWQIVSDQQAVVQSDYEIRVAFSVKDLRRSSRLLWSSGKVNSSQSVHVEYGGPALESMQRVYWQVRVWDNHGESSEWSEPAFWETGILKETEWTASWITRKEELENASLPVQYYRNEFSTTRTVRSARVYVTSLGLYELYLNGEKVGDDLFTPGWTSYHNRLQYQTYDVTDMLQSENTIGAMLGDGWYRGVLGWKDSRGHYGDQLGLLVQLEITYTNGTRETIVSDENWKMSYGAILESDIYNGEKVDARKDPNGWAENGFDDGDWQQAEILDHDKSMLIASHGLPVRAIKEITPIELLTTPNGETVLDMGQNMVGWVRMNVEGQEGDQVTLQFAEVLDKDGNFFTTNLRSAEATDIYTLAGGGPEVFEPHFTFHGFRFVKLEGYPGELTLDDITGVVIHSDMAPTGTFSCSNPLINQLQSNIEWGQRGNFLDIPTDCPQRDERLGWTGDAQVFSTTAAFNFGVAPFFAKWLKDLEADQKPDGMVPHIIPDIMENRGGATGWADAAVIVPWTMYQAYGDVRVLKEQYASMTSWVRFMENKAGEDYLWNNPKDWHWGDWLAFHTSKPDYAGSVTEKDLIATAYFYYSTTLLSKIAGILELNEDVEKYQTLAKKIKAAFINEYITPNGRLVSHTQTAYALALTYDLIPEHLKGKAADYFAKDVERFGHLTTGFLGTPLLCPTLSAIDRDDLAFMLLNRRKFPSWLYPVTQGATTIWERWDTQRPDGTIIKGMNSFNHYAYGAIGEWLYNHVTGINIDPEAPGYKQTIFSPHPGGELTHAEAEFQSMYGRIKSAWKIEEGTFSYEIVIPPNTSATVILPNARTEEVILNSSSLNEDGEWEPKETEKGLVMILGSGTYSFQYPVSEEWN